LPKQWIHDEVAKVRGASGTYPEGITGLSPGF
jgi:hypothetical protein